MPSRSVRQTHEASSGLSMPGFTLIELLVVIAIISILTAITLPMVPGMNDQARIATCESRLQQIGIALRMYAEDHHAYPSSLQALYDGRYVEQQSVLRCDKTGEPYYYRPLSLTADRSEVLGACLGPNTKSGQRPHRHGSVFVRLHVDGSASQAR